MRSSAVSVTGSPTVMEAHEQTWAVSQMIDSEAPEAMELLTRAMAGLTDTIAAPAARGGSARGE